MLLTLTIPAMAAPNKGSNGPVQVKGSGSSFNYEGWTLIADLANGAEENVSYWHFVDSGTNAKTVPSATVMVLTFNGGAENEYVYTWTAKDGFSTNGGGKNAGWVLKTPSGWELTSGYVDKALNQFNLSGKVTVEGSGGYQTYVSIKKYMFALGNLTGVDGFVFDIFPKDGPFDAPLASMTSDTSGCASHTFDTGLPSGDYIVRERVPFGYLPVADLSFTADADGSVKFVDDINYIINTPKAYDFWANIHLSVSDGTNTVTMIGTPKYSTGHGWGFTYIKVTDLSKLNPLTFDIIENKVITGKAVLSVSDNGMLVITLSGITLKNGIEVIQILVSDVESGVNKGPGVGTLKYATPALNADGSYTLYTGIDLTPYLK